LVQLLTLVTRVHDSAVVAVNVALTVVAAVSVIEQVPVPEQPPPDQSANVEPLAGLAVKTTVVPLLYGSEQSVPQLIPAGFEVTTPVPDPALLTVRVRWMSVNVAVTVVAVLTVTTHMPVPLHPPPDQPVNVEPVLADAVNVTLVPKL
jgi:hypothetical protein